MSDEVETLGEAPPGLASTSPANNSNKEITLLLSMLQTYENGTLVLPTGGGGGGGGRGNTFNMVNATY